MSLTETVHLNFLENKFPRGSTMSSSIDADYYVDKNKRIKKTKCKKSKTCRYTK